MARRLNRPTTLGLLLVSGVVLSATPARAIDIVISYDSARSEPHADDPTGARLTAIMQRAASIWEAALPVGGPTITINYWWKTDPTGFLGFHDPDIELGRTEHVLGTHTYNIRFFLQANDGSAIPWFIDSTPLDDSEFNAFAQTLRNDLSAAASGVTIPTASSVAPLEDMLEISYEADCPDTSPAWNRADLLSVALHELGHAAGLVYTNIPEVPAAAAAGHYTPNSALSSRYLCTGGGGCTVHINTNSSGQHLDAPSLMQPNLNAGVRRYPSQVDVLAVAASRTLTDVNFPRKEMLPAAGTGSSLSLRWNQTNNWFGARRPTSGEDVFIRYVSIDDVFTTSNVSARNLTLQRYAPMGGGRIVLRTDTFGISAAGLAVIDGNDTELHINTGGQFKAKDLVVTDDAYVLVDLGGYLNVPRGTVQVQSGEIEYDAGFSTTKYMRTEIAGEIYGRGDCDGINRLHNVGKLRAFEGDLIFRPSGTSARFDIDGDATIEDGILEAIVGSLIFQGRISDAFNGLAEVGQAMEITDARGWTVGSGGILRYTGADDARVFSPTTKVASGGTITTEVLRARLESNATFQAGCVVSVPSAASSLVLIGDNRYEDGTYSGNGIIHQVGDMLVPAGLSVRISAAAFNWDGEAWMPGIPAGSPRTIIEPSATLQIEGVTTLLAADGYDGDIVLGAGSLLNLFNDWQIDGTICLNGGTIYGGTLTISPGAVVYGPGTIDADVVNNGTIYCSGGVVITGALSGTGTASTSCPSCP